MEEQSGSPASLPVPQVSLQSSITAHGQSTVHAPNLVGCHIRGDVNIITAGNTDLLSSQPTLGEVSHTASDIILRVSKKLKWNLRKKFETIFEGIAKRGNPTLLREIYTDLYITVGETEGVNTEHEVWQIDPALKTRPEQDKPINCNDIFISLEQGFVRTVLTKGIAGIGKTVSVQKFVLDWAEEKANQDIDLLFILPFRELNTILNDRSLHELLITFHPELKGFEDVKYYDDCKTLFIFDGLDESKLPFNFGRKRLASLSESASLDELMTNIIEGNLLPLSLVWITSRPAAIDKIAKDKIDRVTEVRGFTEMQKEQYFRKRIRNENLANRMISHVREVRSLEIMCHIPVFCWIIATVLETLMLKIGHERIQSSLTEMYTRFLLIQTNEKKKKYLGMTKQDPLILSDTDVAIILKLGKLAFDKLQECIIVFSEDDLRDYGIDVTEGSVRSGVFTEIVKEEDPMFTVKMYSFVHLSFQEYLAAFFVFYKFAVEEIDVMQTKQDSNTRRWHDKDLYDDDDDDDDDYDYDNSFGFTRKVPQRDLTLHDLQKNVIHKAIKSKRGHLDLFLRFLLGLSMPSNLQLLKSIHWKLENLQENINQTLQHIKHMLREGNESEALSSERCINLFHCLLELDDHSMADEIRSFLTTGKQTQQRLTAAQCSTMAYIILMLKDVVEELDLNKYSITAEGHKRLFPAVRNCRRALLGSCRIKDDDAETLFSALLSFECQLNELDISYNCFTTKGVDLILSGLHNPGCFLQILRLSSSKISPEGCTSLVSALKHSFLKELILDNCSIGDKGVRRLYPGLISPHCQLQTLGLRMCNLSWKSCVYLTVALGTYSVVQSLDLSDNDLQDSGVQILASGLKNPNCVLQNLGLSGCLISEKGCCCLASALRSNPSSSLRELTLSYNHPGKEGKKQLSDLLNNPRCKLQILRLDHDGKSRLTVGLWKYYQDLNIGYTSHAVHSQDSKGVALFPDHEDTYHDLSDSSSDDLLQDNVPTTRVTVSCNEELMDGRFYWEVHWTGLVSIELREDRKHFSGKSLKLFCNSLQYVAVHEEKGRNKSVTQVIGPDPTPGPKTFGVYLDWPEGTLSFYNVSAQGVNHLYTFHSTFSKPMIPHFILSCPDMMSGIASIIIATRCPDSVHKTKAQLFQQLMAREMFSDHLE